VGKVWERLDVEPSGFRRTIAFCGNMTLEPGLGDHFSDPVTPIFDRQDAMIIRLVDALLNEGADQGTAQAFAQADAAILGERGFVDRLKRLRHDRVQIAKALNDERVRVVDGVVGGIGGDAEPRQVRIAFEYAANFFDRICNIADD
jgi:hypothetical protein